MKEVLSLLGPGLATPTAIAGFPVMVHHGMMPHFDGLPEELGASRAAKDEPRVQLIPSNAAGYGSDWSANAQGPSIKSALSHRPIRSHRA
jgi:hypothetical protein